MTRWIRRLNIVLTIGGGFLGLAVTLQALFSLEASPPAVFTLYILFAALYAFGILVGIRLAEGRGIERRLILFYALQIPWISSPILGYRFASGFNLSGALIGFELNGFFRLGSDWQMNLFQALPWGIGLNFFALAMAIYLVLKRKAASNVARQAFNSPPDDPAPPEPSIS